LEDLIQHGLNALRDTLQQDKALTQQNTSIGIVGPRSTGKKANFRTLDDEAVEPYLAEMRTRQGVSAAAEAGAGDDNDDSGAAGDAAMAVEGETAAAPTQQSGANAPAANDGDGDVQMQG
jgi:20S proteasome subunit alpha 6